MSNEAVTEKINFGSLLFSYKGRVGRGPFWAGWAITFGLGILVSFIPPLIFLSLYMQGAYYGKRLHDLGTTAWWFWILFIVLMIGMVLLFVGLWPALDPIFEAVMNGEDPDPDMIQQFFEDNPSLVGIMFGGLALMLLAGLGQFILWLICGIAPGKRGDNKYGPDPRVYGVPGIISD